MYAIKQHQAPAKGTNEMLCLMNMKYVKSCKILSLNQRRQNSTKKFLVESSPLVYKIDISLRFIRDNA